MTLRKAHLILITSGIVLGVLMAAFALLRYATQHDPSLAPTGVIGAIAAVALGTYLRWFLRKTA